MSTLLDLLCQRCGLLLQYRDIWGDAQLPSDAAKRALLAAMGMPAETDELIFAALDVLDRRAWERPLPPVQVVRERPGPHRIALVVPVSEETLPHRWRLRRESGAEDQGEVIPSTLEETGRFHLDGRDLVRRMVTLDLAVEPGYHRVSIERSDGRGPNGGMSFIVAPTTCYQPSVIEGEGRVWGFAAQLYAIRSERNWGVGDFGDLRHLVEFCAEAGADAVLLNPLHALFPDNPDHACPYSPSNRAALNALYLEVEAIADFAECAEAKAMVQAPEFQARLSATRAAPQVDYRGVAAAKSDVLQCLYRHFRDNHMAGCTDRARAFQAFQAGHGEGLRCHALFDALQEHFRRQDDTIWGWPVWPEAYRNRNSPEVAAFATANAPRVEYFEYLQWQTADQLTAAGTRSAELGLGIGVTLDLAIGVAAGSAATWMRPDLYALEASVGAPPDEINRVGQDWGLPPWIPHQLAEAAYQPFIDVLRANMRGAGALRMDHVMGLCRLFWVARGLPAAEGAYVSYPFADLQGILALESQRNRCLVMGEDLGTVPDEVRHDLQAIGALSTRLLYFERGVDDQLTPPQSYPVNAVAAVTTHDLPTLAGYWQGLDIDLRAALHLFPNDAVHNQQIVARAEDRARLLGALQREDLLPVAAGSHLGGYPAMTVDLAAAIYTYLARSPSKLLLVQMEDAFGVLEQPNLPGTVDPVYPCWRLKLPQNLEDWPASAPLQGIVRALRRERPPLRRPAPAGDAAATGLRSWIPRSTYRLQLHRDFDLGQATALLPYLDELGVSHCYLSPLLKARPGSLHGYDIIDHSQLNPEITSVETFDRFVAALKARGMGQIMDMVPNHMGIMGADNSWWLDVLENGQASKFAPYFDIDWYPLAEDLRGRVLLPVLADYYGAILEKGELKLTFDAGRGSFSVFYFEHRFPIDPREYPRILGHDLARLQARLGTEHATLLEFQSLITAFGHLPPRDGVSAEAVAERDRDKEIHKRQLAALVQGGGDIARLIDESVAVFNGGTANYDAMHDLLRAQAYRLAFWRVAADEINYRRFFDINNLVALRMDNPEVFETTHRLVRELLARGDINGLRIDHPDGMYAPREYFERLQAMVAAKGCGKPLYLVVEKVLAAHEYLPESWRVHGTTGYDFGVACGGLVVDGSAEDRFTRLYQGFIQNRPDLAEMARANKRLIMDSSLAGELQVLATQLTRLAKSDRRTCDFTFNSLRGALAEIVAGFEVYRTYVTDEETSPTDISTVNRAVAVAKKRSLMADTSIFDFVRDVLLARTTNGESAARRDAVCAFAMKFQQYSSPVMAKAMEDTTFYQYSRLVSLNEIGGEPGRFGVSVAAFHHENQERARHWPHAMLAGSTHDSKRSEDVRARISALSEMPDDWARALSRWNRLTCGKLGDETAPSRNDEYLLYQTLLGMWPFAAPDTLELAGLTERVEAYMLKAGREAKVHSSWINPNADYEEATRDFVRALLAPGPGNRFLDDFLPLQARIAKLGAFNSLSQQLLRLASPGVPDIYQGGELWDFSLVDPDNRRAVDYPRRLAALAAVKTACAERGGAACAQELIGTLSDGRIKLYLIWKTLTLRRQQEALFRDGDYLPLKAHGLRADHVCAFARRFGGDVLVVVVPRLLGGLIDGKDGLPIGGAVWGNTGIELPAERLPERWTNVLTDETVATRALGEGKGLALAELFQTIPYALLHGRGEGD